MRYFLCYLSTLYLFVDKAVGPTYSQRLRFWFGRDQINDVIEKLVINPQSRSLVMSLWDAGGVPHKELGHGRENGNSDHQQGNSPCLNHLWLRVVNGAISLTAVFRSNDMFAAWPANAMALRALQEHIRTEYCRRQSVHLELGPLVTVSESAHIYERDLESATRIISKHRRKRQKEHADPVGNFVITVCKPAIAVSRFHPATREVIATYEGMGVRDVLEKILDGAPGITSDHAGYIGAELQKAEMCLLDGRSYAQDIPYQTLRTVNKSSATVAPPRNWHTWE